MGALFLKLGEVVSQDCDPARYRAVLDVRDLEGARDVLARLSAFRKNFKEGSRNRATADQQVSDYAGLVRPPAEVLSGLEVSG